MSTYYKLVNKKVIETDDMKDFAVSFEEDRTVARDELPSGVVISTVFLWINHQWDESKPHLLFETMIFWGRHDDYQDRYSTWDEALIWHRKALEIAKHISLISKIKSFLWK